VDGGVLNNLPADVMRNESTIGTVIAVDVAPRQGPRAHVDYGLSLSGVRALRSSVRRTPSQYPTLSSILIRTMLTGAVRSQERELGDGVVDLMLQLHLSGVGLLDFDRVREVADRGYNDSTEAVARWAATEPWRGVGVGVGR
jgi:predicted acylesterase/phospholipase RssA